jgi:hypothetical protein
MSFDADTLAQNAAAPASAKDDAGEFKQHALKDQIEADRYLQQRTAAAGRALPIRLGRFRPPGSV